MNAYVAKPYSFGKYRSEDVKTASRVCRDMGVPYWVEVICISSHRVCYQFHVDATEEQWENLRKLLNIRRIKYGAN